MYCHPGYPLLRHEVTHVPDDGLNCLNAFNYSEDFKHIRIVMSKDGASEKALLQIGKHHITTS